MLIYVIKMFNVNEDNSIETKRRNMKKTRIQSNKTNKLKRLLTHINKSNNNIIIRIKYMNS